MSSRLVCARLAGDSSPPRRVIVFPVNLDTKIGFESPDQVTPGLVCLSSFFLCGIVLLPESSMDICYLLLEQAGLVGNRTLRDKLDDGGGT